MGKIIMKKVFALFLIMSITVGASGKDFFKSLKWKYRPLLIFSTPKDKHLKKQLSELEKNRQGIIERDMKIILLYANLTGTNDGVKMDSAQVEDCYKKFDISHEQFTILLIGKDGRVKMRKTKNISMKEIFSVIDKMPMRQREMRK
jgi:hypothetical protein